MYEKVGQLNTIVILEHLRIEHFCQRKEEKDERVKAPVNSCIGKVDSKTVL